MRSEGNGKRNPLKVTGGLDFGIPRSNPNPDCKSKLNSPGLQHLDSPCGRPSHTSSQSYLHSPSEPCKGSFSRSKWGRWGWRPCEEGRWWWRCTPDCGGICQGSRATRLRLTEWWSFWNSRSLEGEKSENMWRQQLKHMHVHVLDAFVLTETSESGLLLEGLDLLSITLG